MATYRIKAPDGSTWDVNAPEGATEDAVMRYAKAQWAQKSKSPKYEKPDPTAESSFGRNALEGFGKGFYDAALGAGQMLGLVDQATVDENKRLSEPLMNTAGGNVGNFAANLSAAVIPGGNTVKGAALVGAGLSALQPVANVKDEDFWASKVEEVGKGLAFGAAGAGAAKLVGKAQSAASKKVAEIAERVKAKAADVAASETASARSLAGRTAQDAYRQVEHLRDLNAKGRLSKEQLKLYDDLVEELAGKAQEKLGPAAIAKKEAADAYVEAMKTEADRAAALAAEKLSGKEAKNQAMARVKRYWPGLVTGIAGATIGGPAGALIGGTAGLAARPMFHATRRMLQNPAVQYQALSPLANANLDLLKNPRILGLLGPSIYAAQE